MNIPLRPDLFLKVNREVDRAGLIGGETVVMM